MRKPDRQFIDTVVTYYDQHGRQHLPWRKTSQPYRIVVSELMLQQTQVDRVIPKYRAFLRQFPNTKRLAEAPLATVLTAWQGLGYNRRAKLLHQCARHVHETHHGRWPTTYETLVQLPGIGPYTAGAVMAFAYNQPVPLIETNVRTVYLHHFFPTQTGVSDSSILELITAHLTCLPKFETSPRTWYAALMDYGTYIKKMHGNPNSRAKSYTKQSPFAGSNRQIRGAILRALGAGAYTCPQLGRYTELQPFPFGRVETQLHRLHAEGMIQKTGQRYHLPNT